MKNLSTILLKRMLTIVSSLLIYCNVTAQKTRNVSGSQTGTWFSDTTYTITGNVTVPTGQTLTIQSGAKIIFSNGNNTTSQLDVYGTLIAKGTKTDSINFTGGGISTNNQRGPITFESTSTNSILQYVNISQLGYYYYSDITAAIIVKSSSCTISNCNIQNINGTGISIANSVNPTVTNNVFTANAALDAIVGLDNVRLLKGNTPQLKVGLISSSMAVNDTLTTQNLYYSLLANQTVPVSRTLVIDPNVEVQFTNGNNTVSQLDVQGTLKAKGDAGNYINFTGGGISTNNQRGPITFESTSTNSILQYVNISQLGYYYYSDITAAIIVKSSSCTISNCNIQNINGTGISIANSVNPTVTNNVFTANAALDAIVGLDNVRLLKGNTPQLKVGLISSSMAVNDTLTTQNLYYSLLANQTVPVSRTLVIDPNVEVQFTNGNNTVSQLDVQGTLKAKGDAGNYINFTGGGISTNNQRGPITFESTSTNSILQYVNISQLGYYYYSDITAAIIVKSSSCTISNCNIQNINGTGISIANSVNPTVTNNVFTANAALDAIVGLDNVRLLKGNTPQLKVGLISSSMAVNDTLTTQNLYYSLLANQTVPVSRTLVIDPNVEVQFTNGNNTVSQLDVQGTLKAKGDAGNYINFTGGGISTNNQRGPITFESTSTNSILQYVNISQLGYYYYSDITAAIIVKSSSCTISNCNIQNINGTGISIANSVNPTVTNNVFTANAALDAIVGLDNVRLLKGNTPQLKVGLISSSMAVNDTLTTQNLYYSLLANQTVPVSRTLVIDPNVEVQFTNGNNTVSQLDVQGTLKAKGDAGNYINFTGGGISTNNQRGPITFESTSTNSILQYVNISQLGYYYYNNTTPILLIKSSSCIIANTIIQNCNGVAIQVTTSASPTFLQDCFYTNISGAVLSSSGSPKFQNCNFVGNKSGIVNTSTTDNVTATNCWWGDASGPFQRTTNATGVGDSVSVGVTYTNFALMEFDCSAAAGPLPVTLLDFQAASSGDYVNCNWQTSTEINTSSFIVEHSIDGINFTQIGVVDASSNSSIVKSYQFTDMAPNNANNYYRLKIVDKDGKYAYSKIVTINIKSGITLTISPNPVINNLFVQIQRDVKEKVLVQVTDMEGRILYQRNQQLQTGITGFSVNTSLLSKGLYRLVLRGTKIESKAFVKE